MKKSICGFVDYILENYFALSLSLKKKLQWKSGAELNVLYLTLNLCLLVLINDPNK